MGTSFAENLKALRLKAGLSQAAMARLAKLPQPALSQLENSVRPATPRVMRSLCVALSVTQEDLSGTDSTFSFEKAELYRLVNRMSDVRAQAVIAYIKTLDAQASEAP